MHINQNIASRDFVNATVSAVVALTGLFVSCARIEDGGDDLACLTFSSISVDYSVENLPATKAVLPEIVLPEAEDFTVRITGGKGDPLVFAPGEIPDKVLLDAGTYTVEAFYGENAFDEPYFYKSVQVSLLPEDEKTVSLTGITLGNAMVAVTLPNDFDTHMSLSSIVLSDSNGGSTSVEAGVYAYAPSGSEVYVTFNGTNSAGQDKSIKVTLGTLDPQCAYDIVCNLNLPTLSFADQSDGAWAGRLYLTSLATSDKAMDMSAVKYMLSSDGGVSWIETVPESKDGYWLIRGLDKNKTYSIKAVLGELVSNSWTFSPSESSSLALSLAHTKDSSGNLDGTKATVSGDVPYPAGLAGLISSKGGYGAELTDTGGNIVRTLSAKTGDMAVANNWPYLPQGTYTLKPYYQIGEDKVYLAAKPSAVSPAPVFTVKANAETSYSRYLAGSANKNDSGTGDKVMNISASVTISDAVLGNGNYSGKKTVILTYDGSSMLTSDALTSRSVVPDVLVASGTQDLTGQTWGTHTLAASVTFDGVTSGNSLQCHVTGIPYDYDLQNNKPDANWVVSGDSDYDAGQRIYYYYSSFWTTKYYAKLYTPAFRFPASANIAYSLTFRYSSAGSAGQKLTIYTGAVYDTSTYSNTNSQEISSVTTANGTVRTVSHSLNGVSDGARISIYHNENKNNNAAINSCYLRKISISYQ